MKTYLVGLGIIVAVALVTHLVWLMFLPNRVTKIDLPAGSCVYIPIEANGKVLDHICATTEELKPYAVKILIDREDKKAK